MISQTWMRLVSVSTARMEASTIEAICVSITTRCRLSAVSDHAADGRNQEHRELAGKPDRAQQQASIP